MNRLYFYVLLPNNFVTSIFILQKEIPFSTDNYLQRIKKLLFKLSIMIRLILVLSALSLVSCKATMMNMALKTFKKDAGKTFPEVWLEDAAGNRALTDSIFTTEVAFLNIWGTWCSPCLNEIDDLNVLMDRMVHNQNVSFINICAKSTREDWLRVVSEKKLQGKNYFISDTEFERMSQQIDSPLEGFPMH
ncbi:MAG: hypothetical protein EAS52_19970, partial [Parapedobacter sp.]